MENIIREVTITTEEYKALITAAVENRKDFDYMRDRCWRAEKELKETKEEVSRLRGIFEKNVNMEPALVENNIDMEEILNG